MRYLNNYGIALVVDYLNENLNLFFNRQVETLLAINELEKTQNIGCYRLKWYKQKNILRQKTLILSGECYDFCK